MNKIIIAIAALLSSACVVPAHSTPHPAPAHRSAPPVVRPYHPHPQQINIQAWVWNSGYPSRNGWVHGRWELRTIPRHMINRNPHTHVRYMKGRGRPHPPPRRYR